MKITKKLAKKVLEVVDAGLCSGLGDPIPGQMCVEAAVCYAMGLPHGDEPACVSPVVRKLKIALNDAKWSSNEARAKGMRKLAVVQLGTNKDFNEIEFVKRVSKISITKVAPRALRYAASIHPDKVHKAALKNAAILCEREGSEPAAWSAAKSAVWSAAESAAESAELAVWSAAESAAWSARSAVWSAAESVAKSVWSAAESVAKSAAESAAESVAKSAAESAVWSAAESAKSAAESAAWSAESAVRSAAESVAKSAKSAADIELTLFANEVVKILVDLRAKGAQYLYLTE